MIRKLHIVVDNNFPKTLARELGDFWRPNYPEWTVRHENEVAKAATIDSHWIPKLRTIEPQGDWLIITSDEGRNDRKASEKLPILCKNHGHAYIILTQIAGRSENFKAAIAGVWPQFPEVLGVFPHLIHRPYVHIRLGQHTSRGGAISYRFQILGGSLETFLKDKQ